VAAPERRRERERELAISLQQVDAIAVQGRGKLHCGFAHHDPSDTQAVR
jgi:hypothetical protein